MDRLCRSLIALPLTLGWLTGLLPVRNPLVTWTSGPRVGVGGGGGASSRDIVILPHLHVYTVYALLINLLNLALYLDAVVYGRPGARLQPDGRMNLKELVFLIYQHLVSFINFGTRLYFIYKARAMLRLCQQIQAHVTRSARQARLRGGHTPDLDTFRLPTPILLLLTGHFVIRFTFQIVQINKALGMSNYFGSHGNSYLSAISTDCPECQAVLYFLFGAVPYFVTAVVPWEFAVLLIVPLVNIFQELYEKVVQDEHTAAEADGDEGVVLPHRHARGFSKATNGTAAAFIHVGNGVGAIGVGIGTKFQPSPPPSLVSQFEEITSYFVDFNHIFSPKISLLFLLSVTSLVNGISALRDEEVPLFYQSVIILWEVAVLSFIEVGCWAHSKIEGCQDSLRKLLVMPDSFGRRRNATTATGGANAASGGPGGGPGSPEERETVARLICNWNWRLRAGRGFLIIDRSLYASILTFMLSYSIMLFQIDAASKAEAGGGRGGGGRARPTRRGGGGANEENYL